MEIKTYSVPKRFGITTRLCHGLIVILVIMQYTLVYREMLLSKIDPWKLQMILLHKSFGVIVLGLGCLMLMTRWFKGRPAYLLHAGVNPHIQRLQNGLAKTVHVVLYVSIILMPLAGILMSLYGGKGVAFFGHSLFSPNFIVQNKSLGTLFYNTHVFTSYVLIALVFLHVVGALYHKWVYKDEVFERMF